MKDNMFKVDPTARVNDSAFAEIDTMRSGHGWGAETHAATHHTHAGQSEGKHSKAASATGAKAKTCAAKPSTAPKSNTAKPRAVQPKTEGFVVVDEVVIIEK